MEKLKSFITEVKEEPYNLVMFHNSHEHLRDVGKEDAPDYLLITKAAKSVGVDFYSVLMGRKEAYNSKISKMSKVDLEKEKNSQIENY